MIIKVKTHLDQISVLLKFIFLLFDGKNVLGLSYRMHIRNQIHRNLSGIQMKETLITQYWAMNDNNSSLI